MKDIHSFVILAYNESDDLEECIKSIKNQSVKSNVLIVTSTKNDHIIDLASEYSLGVMVNDSESNKGNDYNFALESVNTELITLVHQDDLYDRNYAKEVINCYKENQDALIIFTDYYEIHFDKKIKRNATLLRKKIYNYLLKYKLFNNITFFKRMSLRFENAICTSGVTFVRKNINNSLFPTDLIYNNDWAGFEKLSFINKPFVFLPLKLIGYRMDYCKEKTFDYIKEDIIMYKKFWPSKLVNYIYRNKLLKLNYSIEEINLLLEEEIKESIQEENFNDENKDELNNLEENNNEVINNLEKQSSNKDNNLNQEINDIKDETKEFNNKKIGNDIQEDNSKDENIALKEQTKKNKKKKNNKKKKDTNNVVK